MYIRVTVIPKAKKENLQKISGDRFKIAVREPAERNLANARVVELLANYYNLPRGKIKIVTGHHSPVKMLSVDLGD